MAGKTLQLDIKIDGKLNPTVTAAFTKLAAMANKANKTMQIDKIRNSVNQMAGVSQKIMKTVATGAVVAGTAFSFIAGRGVQLASDLAEVQNVVDVTFGKNAQQVNAWSKTMLDAYGLSELSAKRYSSTMGAMLKSSGLADAQIMGMSTTLTQLSADFASFYNLDSETAFQKIRAGISGETEPLKQLGINMSVANLEAFAMSKGITKSFSAMTQAEQATLRYNYILGVSKDAQGDFTRTQGGFANQMRLAKEKTDQLMLSIGEKLLPKLTPLIQKFNDFISTIKPETLEIIGKTFTDIADGGLKTIGDILKFVGPIAMGLFNFLKDNGELVKAVLLGVAVAFGILTAAQIAFNIAAWANPVNLIILGILAAIAIVTAAIYLLWSNWDTVVKWLGDVWNGFVNGLRSAWESVWNGIVSVFKGYINIWIAGINFIIGALNKVQFTAPDWVPGIGGKTLGINIPLIPYLAKGATVTGPMLAMIGEAGTETVVPHNNKPRSQALALEAARGAGLNTGGNTYVFSPVISGGSSAEVRQAIEDAYEEFKAFIERYQRERERVSYGV